MGFSSWVHLDVDLVVAETENALLLEIDGDQHWIPRSQIDGPDKYEKGDKGVTVSVTEWIAKQKGLDD
jgi:hypothetical protein